MNSVQNYETETRSTSLPLFNKTDVTKARVMPQLSPLLLETVIDFYNNHLGFKDIDTWLASCQLELAEKLHYRSDEEGTQSMLAAMAHTVQFITRIKAIYDASEQIEYYERLMAADKIKSN